MRDLVVVAKLVWISSTIKGVEAKEVGGGVKLGPELLSRQLPARPYINIIGDDSTAAHDCATSRDSRRERLIKEKCR